MVALAMTALAALCLTPAARDWLTQTTSARVLNVFDRACNLINQDDAILALVTSDRGLTPFAMVVGGDGRIPFRAVSEASPVNVRANDLVVGPLRIDFAMARLWSPIPDWPALRGLFATDTTRLHWIGATVMEDRVKGSLLDLFDARANGRSSFEQAGLDRARRGARDLVTGLLVGSTDQCLTGVQALAGLGGGLTPAGDDFMVGTMFAIWAGLYGPGAAQFCAPVVEAASPLTTTLSAAYLRSAARGECMAHWHAIFDALLRSDAEMATAAIKSLMSVGHTSGADALAGFLAVQCLGDNLQPQRGA